MLTEQITTYKDVIMIGQVFKKDGINLIYGESGLGKTVSTIKALNEDGIKPILLDYDHNDSPTANECEYIHIDGILYMDRDTTMPKDSVIVLDTWQMFLTNGGTMQLIQDMNDAGNTIIIVAHNKPLASKQDVPDIDPKYSNHFSSKLYMEFDKGSKTKTNPRPEGYNLTVLKLRGYKGPRTIINWMRQSNDISDLIR